MCLSTALMAAGADKDAQVKEEHPEYQEHAALIIFLIVPVEAVRAVLEDRVSAEREGHRGEMEGTEVRLFFKAKSHCSLISRLRSRLGQGLRVLVVWVE